MKLAGRPETQTVSITAPKLAFLIDHALSSPSSHFNSYRSSFLYCSEQMRESNNRSVSGILFGQGQVLIYMFE